MAGSITKKDNGKYLARMFVGYDASGKRKYWSSIFDKKGDAKLALAAKLKERNDYGAVLEPARITLSQHLQEWLETSVRPRVAPKTYEGYKYAADRYIVPQIGSYELRRLTPEIIQSLYNSLQTDKGLTPRTVRHTHAVLHNALKQAVKWQKLYRNPAELVDLPKRQKKEMKAMNQDEAKAFLDAVYGDRWQALFELLIITGMRPGEALGLKWTDIDWDARTVTVQRSLSRPKNGKDWILTQPKTKGSRRTIPLPPEMIESLRKHQKRQAAEILQTRVQEGKKKERAAREGSAYIPREYARHGLVFANQTGEPADGQNILNRHFKPITEALGLSGYRLYDLRHTCATLLLQAGTNPKIVAEILGHSSITLTLDTYSHVSVSMKQSASDMMRSMIY